MKRIVLCAIIAITPLAGLAQTARDGIVCGRRPIFTRHRASD